MNFSPKEIHILNSCLAAIIHLGIYIINLIIENFLDYKYLIFNFSI